MINSFVVFFTELLPSCNAYLNCNMSKSWWEPYKLDHALLWQTGSSLENKLDDSILSFLSSVWDSSGKRARILRMRKKPTSTDPNFLCSLRSQTLKIIETPSRCQLELRSFKTHLRFLQIFHCFIWKSVGWPFFWLI